MTRDPAAGLHRPDRVAPITAKRGAVKLVVQLDEEQIEELRSTDHIDIEIECVVAEQGLLKVERRILDIVQFSTDNASEAGLARPAVRIYLGEER